MPDREKVINAIECCIDGCLCAECDYEGIEGCWNNVLLTDALAMLKEQDETIKELQNAYGYLQKQFFESQDKLLKEQEKPCGLFECFHCGKRAVVWGGDFNMEDYGYEGGRDRPEPSLHKLRR